MDQGVHGFTEKLMHFTANGGSRWKLVFFDEEKQDMWLFFAIFPQNTHIQAIKICELVENSIPKAKNYSNYRQSYSSYKLEYEAYEKRRNEEIRVEEAIRKKEERNIKRREYTAVP
jgi:hypothetical protein